MVSLIIIFSESSLQGPHGLAVVGLSWSQDHLIPSPRQVDGVWPGLSLKADSRIGPHWTPVLPCALAVQILASVELEATLVCVHLQLMICAGGLQAVCVCACVSVCMGGDRITESYS